MRIDGETCGLDVLPSHFPDSKRSFTVSFVRNDLSIVERFLAAVPHRCFSSSPYGEATIFVFYVAPEVPGL